MNYLTENDLKVFPDTIEKSFLDKTVRKSEELFDVLTLRFYDKIPYKTDYSWRKKAVKRAILSQVEYFIETGETTTEGLNSTPQSVSIGRTRVTTVHGNSSKSTKPLACDEFYLHLSGTGLLYRGVGL